MQLEKIGRYQVRSVLGRGASGVVFLAHDPVIGRDVALKTLRVDLDEAQAREFRARFMVEARAAGRLTHPHIVTVFDVGEDAEQGLLFIAMEHLAGRNLKDLLEAGIRLEPVEIAAVGAGLADALGYAHDNGVVHRDIKPANIILTNHGPAKLTDFGVARMDTSQLTTQGTVIGTPSYMSPEQVSGAAVDGRTDIYSLGVVLFELATGERPFQGSSFPELALKIAQQKPPRVASLRPDLRDSLAPVIDRCLVKTPGKRFQSGRELADALRTLAGATPVPAARPAVPAGDARPPVVDPDEDPFVFTQPSETVDLGTRPRRRIAALLRGTSRGTRLAAVAVATAAVVTAATLALHDRGPSPKPTAVMPTDASATASDQLVAEARARLAAGDPDGAMAAARDALELQPSSAQAAEILEVARQLLEARQEPARIGLDFECPLSRGTLEVSLDGNVVETIPWDFTRKVVFGITRGGRGEVTGAFQVPPGRHRLEVRLTSPKRGLVAEHELEHHFPPGSRWRLVIDMPKKKSEPKLRIEHEP